MVVLIEESAIKEYCRTEGCRMPKNLWKWLQDEGPIIRADVVRKVPGGFRVKAPFGMIDLPEDAVTEALD